MTLEEAQRVGARVRPRHKPAREPNAEGVPVLRPGAAPEVRAVWEEVVPDLVRRKIAGARDAVGLETLCALIAQSRGGHVSASLGAELRTWLRAFALLPDSRLREMEPPAPKPEGKLRRYIGGAR